MTNFSRSRLEATARYVFGLLIGLPGFALLILWFVKNFMSSMLALSSTLSHQSHSAPSLPLVLQQLDFPQAIWNSLPVSRSPHLDQIFSGFSLGSYLVFFIAFVLIFLGGQFTRQASDTFKAISEVEAELRKGRLIQSYGGQLAQTKINTNIPREPINWLIVLIIPLIIALLAAIIGPLIVNAIILKGKLPFPH